MRLLCTSDSSVYCFLQDLSDRASHYSRCPAAFLTQSFHIIEDGLWDYFPLLQWCRNYTVYYTLYWIYYVSQYSWPLNVCTGHRTAILSDISVFLFESLHYFNVWEHLLFLCHISIVMLPNIPNSLFTIKHTCITA